MNSLSIKKDCGAVLVMALLFTIILTLLAIGILESSILEIKMSNYYRNNNLALLDAEAKLAKVEKKFDKGAIPKEAILISNRVCGVEFYQIETFGRSGKSTRRVQSTFAVVGDISKCKPKPKIIAGRQSFRI